jgi:multiple sugar transport system substrate-binding protein
MVVVVTLLVGCGQKEEPTPATPEPVTISVLAMQQAGLTPDEMSEIADRFTEQNPGVNVEVSYLSYDEIYDKLVTSMAGDNPAYDVFLVDDPWVAQFAEAGWLLDITDRVPTSVKEGFFEAAWDITTVDGKIYGMPWMIDQKMFFYNKALLAEAGYENPPTTWEEMEEMAMTMKEQGVVEYPMIWSWAQAEAAICDFVALLYGNNAQFFDEYNNPVFNEERGVEVLAWMKETIDNGITNPSSISAVEEDVRGVFSQGKAAFALNWPYMYELTQFDEEESQVTGDVGLALVPVFEQARAEGLTSATIDGSMGFAISADTEHADEAWAYLEYLTSKPIQMEFSAHLPPVWESAYEEPDVETLLEQSEVNEVLVPMFSEQFQYSYVRPKVPYYTEASTTIQLALQEALSGAKAPQEALDEAAADIVEMQE